MGNPFSEMLAVVRRVKEAPARLAQELATESLKLVHEGFSSQRDPYGERWAEKADGTPFDPRNSIEWSARPKLSPLGFFLDFAHVAFVFQQQGTRFIRSRKMVPVISRGLGLWGPRYAAVARRVYGDAVRGRS